MIIVERKKTIDACNFDFKSFYIVPDKGDSCAMFENVFNKIKTCGDSFNLKYRAHQIKTSDQLQCSLDILQNRNHI